MTHYEARESAKRELYFCESATADNYILLITEKGLYASNCAPDGCFAGVSLHLEEGETAEGKAAAILAAMDEPEGILSDMATEMDDGGWMGDALTYEDGLTLTLADFILENENMESWQQDTICKII